MKKIFFYLTLAGLIVGCTNAKSRQPSSSLKKEEFLVGFNQGWIYNRYGSQFTQKGFDEKELRRIFKLSKEAHGSIVRMWLFPGHKPLFFDVQKKSNTNEYLVIKESEAHLQYIERMLQIALEEGVKLNLTLFNGVDAHLDLDQEYLKSFWNDLLNNKNSLLEAFLSGPLEKVLNLINSKKEYREVVPQLDIANEINAYLTFFGRNGIGFKNGYEDANKFICKIYKKIKKHPVGKTLQVTASLGYGRESIDLYYNKLPWPSCVDFFDVHIYQNRGKIRGCKKIVAYAKEHNKKVQLGEFGQFQFPKKIDDKRQSRLTKNFLLNAKKCGFSGALAWRLTEPNTSGMYNYNAGESFFEDGKFRTDESGNRPAYYIFKETAAKILGLKDK